MFSTFDNVILKIKCPNTTNSLELVGVNKLSYVVFPP
jgi:hypothetical protein